MKSTAASKKPIDRPDVAAFVELCAAQILSAIGEVDGEFDAMTAAVIAANRHADHVFDAVSSAAGDSGDELTGFRSEAQRASTRLQSLDRFHQRLGNACANLQRVAELIRSNALPLSSATWQQFLQNARSAYTMQAERVMFDAAFDHQGPSTSGNTGDDSTDPVLFDR